MEYSLKEIVKLFGGNVSEADAAISVSKVASLKQATQNSITFFTDTKHLATLKQTDAAVVILKPEHATLTDKPKIVADNPYAYFAKVSTHLNPKPPIKSGIHPTASIDSTALVAQSASIAENVVIGANAKIAENVVIGANTVVEQGVGIGPQTIIESNVAIKYGTQIGTSCHLFSGCSIGGDGFGYAEEAGQWVKIPQVGKVVIGDHVDIGANTTVDRGALDDTIIHDGVKLDNLIQVGHNCIIGAHTVIAGCVGIAGSAVIGEHCKIGGAAMILGHLNIADNVTISPGSMITRTIKQAGTYTALMPFQTHESWLKTAASIRHINQMNDRIKALEQLVKAQQDDNK